MGKPNRHCALCGGATARGNWCEACARAWDRQRLRDDGTILAAMNWAARRARRFAAKVAPGSMAWLDRLKPGELAKIEYTESRGKYGDNEPSGDEGPKKRPRAPLVRPRKNR